MVSIKSKSDVEKMLEAGKIAANALNVVEQKLRPGMTTKDIDKIVDHEIRRHGAVPNFYQLYGFPGSACVSVNEEVIHGIPGSRVLEEGDIVSLDVGAHLRGYHGDCARTFPVGEISPEARRLIEVTKQSFFDGISAIHPQARIGDISAAVQHTAESAGFSVVREYVGHGVGENLHEEPDVPNYGIAGHGPRLYAGMTIAVEPMITAGKKEVRSLADGWTVVTCDGSLAAHYENTVAVTSDGARILTEV
jgi:methionyl aminopeptidase